MARRRKLGRFSPEAISVALGDPASVDLDQLIVLIRSTNPTRRVLDAPERARRYALKARLQSLVLRRFADCVELVPTPRPGIVAIRLRGRRGDAGHAAITALDPDVRPIRSAG